MVREPDNDGEFLAYSRQGLLKSAVANWMLVTVELATGSRWQRQAGVDVHQFGSYSGTKQAHIHETHRPGSCIYSL
jgi:hypothetical protein